MQTIQGKEFNYNDVLLYATRSNEIVAIVNDSEQLRKYRLTGQTKDAPICILPYADETERLIAENMKRIEVYKITENNLIEVSYTDGTREIFDLSNKAIVEKNLARQRGLSQEKIQREAVSVSSEVKEEKKKNTSKNGRRYLAGVLAALVIAGGAAASGYFSGRQNSNNNNAPLDPVNPTDDPVTRQDLRRSEQVEETVTTVSQFLNEGKALHEETLAKNSFVLKYQQVANIKWDENLATEVVEFLNDVYPTSMTYMSNANANAEMTEALEALELLVSGNLNPETKDEDIIDLGQYISNENYRPLINNALVVSRMAINESIGEPVNGTILDEGDWASVNKFSREYVDAVDQLLNYEYDTVTDPLFLELPAGIRYLVTSIFNQANAGVVPTWTHINRDSNELYYRYFTDVATDVNYIPRPTENGTVEYVGTDGSVYSENEIFAMAGRPLVLDDRNYTENVNPNLHQCGIQTEIDKVYEEAREEIFAMKNTYTVSK